MNNHLLPIFLPYVPLAMKLTPVCEMPLPNGEGESTRFNICFGNEDILSTSTVDLAVSDFCD